MLSAAQFEQYERDGYLILRNQFSDAEMSALDAVADRNPPSDDGKLVGNWPEPGRYTLAKSSWSDPSFVHFAEHPRVVAGAKDLLKDDVHLPLM